MNKIPTTTGDPYLLLPYVIFLQTSKSRLLMGNAPGSQNRSVNKKKSSLSGCRTAACLLPVRTLDKGALETLSFETND